MSGLFSFKRDSPSGFEISAMQDATRLELRAAVAERNERVLVPAFTQQPGAAHAKCRILKLT